MVQGNPGFTKLDRTGAAAQTFARKIETSPDVVKRLGGGAAVTMMLNFWQSELENGTTGPIRVSERPFALESSRSGLVIAVDPQGSELRRIPVVANVITYVEGLEATAHALKNATGGPVVLTGAEVVVRQLDPGETHVLH